MSGLTCSALWFEFHNFAWIKRSSLENQSNGMHQDLFYTLNLKPFDSAFLKQLLQGLSNNMFVVIVISSVDESKAWPDCSQDSLLGLFWRCLLRQMNILIDHKRHCCLPSKSQARFLALSNLGSFSIQNTQAHSLCFGHSYYRYSSFDVNCSNTRERLVLYTCVCFFLT